MEQPPEKIFIFTPPFFTPVKNSIIARLNIMLDSMLKLNAIIFMLEKGVENII